MTIQIFDKLDNQTFVDCKIYGYILFCDLLEKLNFILTYIIKSFKFFLKKHLKYLNYTI